MAQENYDIFISYSRKDSAIADQICAALDSAGITYFIDRQGIGGGFEFPAVLAENIVNSKIFLLLASKNSYESKFTMNEIVFAFNKKPKNAILPYIIDNSSLPISLEFVFAGINWRNMTEHPIDPTLVDDLLKLLGRERENKVVEDAEVATETTPHLTEREKHLLSLHNLEFVIFKENGKYGFKLRSTGEIVIPLKYDAAYDFREGLAAVDLNGKWGFIDKTGKDVIPFKYDNGGYFCDGLVNVKLNGKLGYIDKTGKEVIPFKYDGGSYFYDGLANVSLNSKNGFIDKTGKEVIPLKYDIASDFYAGLARVNIGAKWNNVSRKKEGGKWGYIDKTGKEVIPLKYDDASDFYDVLAKVKLNNKWGYIDKTGKEVIPLKYDDAWRFEFGKAKVMTKNIFGIEKEFYIDKNGNRVEE